MSDHIRKIDPKLRGPAARARIATLKEKRDSTVHAFVEVSDAQTRNELEKQSRELEKKPREERWIKYFVHLIEGYCTVTVREDHLDDLARMPGVAEIEAVQYPRPLLNESVPSIHGWEGIPEQEHLKQGAGAVIGIVDYGLDFWLDDFRNPGGERSTRVASLWDQDLEPKDGEQPPPKYGYGVEYSRKQIDAELQKEPGRVALRHNPLNPESNISGHGTHVAGIAAGNGTSDAGGYVGVAPAATLVFVNLPRHTIVDHVNTPRGTLANSVNLAHAIAFCFEKAEELKMPCVVNLSMGFNGGGHDGNMIVEWIIDALLSKAGRAVVIAAGNEHEAHKVYCGGRVKAQAVTDIKWDTGRLDQPADDQVFVLGDPTANEVEIWYSNQCKLEVQLVAPGDNQAFGWIQPGDQAGPYRFDGGEEALISSDQQTPWGGAARIHIRLTPGGSHDWIRYGTWIIRLRAMEVSAPEKEKGGVRFDAWIERTIPDPGAEHKELWSRFQDYDPETAITLTTPGTARRAITVASCKNSDPVEASDFSSRGPTRDERKKPEVAAPGDWITSSGAGGRPGNGIPVRTQRWGTSMSAPHVAGIVARLLGRHNYLLAEEIRSLLMESATAPGGQEDWDRNRGYGKVNAAAAMKLLEKKLAR